MPLSGSRTQLFWPTTRPACCNHWQSANKDFEGVCLWRIVSLETKVGPVLGNLTQSSSDAQWRRWFLQAWMHNLEFSTLGCKNCEFMYTNQYLNLTARLQKRSLTWYDSLPIQTWFKLALFPMSQILNKKPFITCTCHLNKFLACAEAGCNTFGCLVLPVHAHHPGMAKWCSTFDRIHRSMPP